MVYLMITSKWFPRMWSMSSVEVRSKIKAYSPFEYALHYTEKYEIVWTSLISLFSLNIYRISFRKNILTHHR